MQIVQAHTALAHAERLVQSGAAGFMAHVAAVGQIVGAERPREQLQQERRLVAEPAGGVEQRLVGRIEPAQLGCQQVEGVVPADRLVVIRPGPLDHRFGQPALLVEPHVRLRRQLGDGVLAEELSRDPAGGRLVVDVFGAVLAVLVPVPLTGLRLRPCTAGAVNPVGLIDVQQIDRGSHKRGLLQRILQCVHHGRHPSGRLPGRLDFWVLDARIVSCGHSSRPFLLVRDGRMLANA